MNIGTQKDFKKYLLYVKKHNDGLSEKEKEGFFIGGKYLSPVIRPSDESYYEWYIDNILSTYKK